MGSVNSATAILCICTIGLIWFSIFIADAAKEKERYGAFQEDICNITDVRIPTEYPNSSHHEGWTSCSCHSDCNRHHCQPRLKSYKACIKFYTDIAPNIMIRDKFNTKQVCTFDLNCVCPPNHNGYNIQLIKANETYYSNHNELEICYLDEPITEIYLTDNYDYGNMIALVATFSIMLCVIMATCIALKKILNDRRTEGESYLMAYYNNSCLECRCVTNGCCRECYMVFFYMCMGFRRLCCCINPDDDSDYEMEETSTRTSATRINISSSRNYNTFRNPYENGQMEYLMDMDDKTSPTNEGE